MLELPPALTATTNGRLPEDELELEDDELELLELEDEALLEDDELLDDPEVVVLPPQLTNAMETKVATSQRGIGSRFVFFIDIFR